MIFLVSVRRLPATSATVIRSVSLTLFRRRIFAFALLVSLTTTLTFPGAEAVAVP